LNVRYRKKTGCREQVMRREKWQKNNQNQRDKNMKRKETRRHCRKPVIHIEKETKRKINS